MNEQIPPQPMTIAEQMEAFRNRQASFQLEAEVRAAAKAQHLTTAETDTLVQKARVDFIFVSGLPLAVAANRQTRLRNDLGLPLSVAEWFDKQLPQPSPGAAPVVSPPHRNPFKRESWNLTEQMRVQRIAPSIAAKLQAEAL